MNGNKYAAMNLRTIKENIMSYASYAEGHLYSPLYEKIETAQQAVQELIDAIDGKTTEVEPIPTKQQIIQYLTDLMATIQNAYYKGRMMDCPLRVHDSGEAGISIDLYNFDGDGKPVCEGLTFNIDGKNEMQRAFCLVYNPDYEEEHLWIMCFNDKPCDHDDDYELLPEDLPETVLKNIVAWLEQAMQPIN